MEKEKEEDIMEKEKEEDIMEKENCCGREGRDIEGSIRGLRVPKNHCQTPIFQTVVKQFSYLMNTALIVCQTLYMIRMMRLRRKDQWITKWRKQVGGQGQLGTSANLRKSNLTNVLINFHPINIPALFPPIVSFSAAD